MPALLGAKPLIDYAGYGSNLAKITAFATILPKINARGLIYGSGMLDEQNPGCVSQLWVEIQAIYAAAGGVGLVAGGPWSREPSGPTPSDDDLGIPSGMIALVDSDGAYVVDSDGAYLVEPV